MSTRGGGGEKGMNSRVRMSLWLLTYSHVDPTAIQIHMHARLQGWMRARAHTYNIFFLFYFCIVFSDFHIGKYLVLTCFL